MFPAERNGNEPRARGLYLYTRIRDTIKILGRGRFVRTTVIIAWNQFSLYSPVYANGAGPAGFEEGISYYYLLYCIITKRQKCTGQRDN